MFDAEFRTKRGVIVRQLDNFSEDLGGPVKEGIIDIDGQGRYRGAQAVDGDPRFRQGFDDTAKQGQAAAMGKEGQGADIGDDLDAILDQRPLGRWMPLLGRHSEAVEKGCKLDKIGGGDTEGADLPLAFPSLADKGEIDPLPAEMLKEIGKRSISERERPIGDVDKFLAEFYSPYADLHRTGF